MPAGKIRKNQQKASSQRFYGLQQPTPAPNLCFRVLQSQLFQEDDDDCSFWPPDSLMASVVEAFNREDEEEDLLRRMTSLSLVMAFGNRSRSSNAIGFESQKSERDQKTKKEDRPPTFLRGFPNSRCRKQFGRTMRDLNIPFSFSERRLREIQNFTRYATKIAQRNRRKGSRSSKDLVVSSSPLARIGSRIEEEADNSVEVVDSDGAKVKLRRCLSVPQLDHLTSIPFESVFSACSTQEIDMLPEIEEA